MSQFGYLYFNTFYGGSQKINEYGIVFFDSLNRQLKEDRDLNLEQAINKYQSLSSQSSFLLAQIDNDGVCHIISERNSNQLRSIASMFKIWVLATAAESLKLGESSLDQEIAYDFAQRVPGSIISRVEGSGTLFSLIDVATLMIGLSENTATDMLHGYLGRELIYHVVKYLNLDNSSGLTPLLKINEQFHLYSSFSPETALAYAFGTETFQYHFIDDHSEELNGPVIDYPYFNTQMLIDGSWKVSAMDTCKTYAALRQLPEESNALKLVDTALGSALRLQLRNNWDRVWYKGGSLLSGNDFHVLTYSWLLENQGENAYVVIALANDRDGLIPLTQINSITSRILELVKIYNSSTH